MMCTFKLFMGFVLCFLWNGLWCTDEQPGQQTDEIDLAAWWERMEQEVVAFQEHIRRIQACTAQIAREMHEEDEFRFATDPMRGQNEDHPEAGMGQWCERQ